MRYTFNTFNKDITTFQREIETILKDFTAKTERDAQLYKEDVCAQRRQEHIENARQRMQQAYADLGLASRVAANKMRDSLKTMMTRPVNAVFLDNMRTFKEFGIKLHKNDLPTYITLASGNLIALRILAEVAKESGFELKYNTIDMLQADIDRVESFGKRLQNYAPADLWGVAEEVFPDVAYYRDDGTVYMRSGRPTSTSFILSNAIVSSMQRDLDGEVLTRWTASVVPTVEEIKQDLQNENKGKSAEWHEEAANIEHEKTVKAAASSVEVCEETPAVTAAKAFNEEKKRVREAAANIPQKYL